MVNKKSSKNLRTCDKGHTYYKSSDCPVCEQERKPSEGFLALLGAPARRALESRSIMTLQDLSNFSEPDILKLHGVGPSSMPTLRSALKSKGLSFKK